MQMEIDFRPLAVRDIRTITFQVLTALAKLKEIGIVHADIKPENIMLVNQHLDPFRLKLIDFGSSYTINEVGSLRVPYLQSRYYRAPEILLGLPFCEKMDMWSLGCVIAELYLGYPLYQADSELELAHYICDSHGMPPVSLLNSASKTKLFFDLVKNHTGEYQWKLKPARVRLSTSGLKMHAVTLFDQLEMGALVPDFGREDSAETADRWCMEDLLKCMLTLDEQQRISASQALCHSFVSLQHLCVSDSYRQYCEFSVQGYKEALIPYQPSMDGKHSPSQSSVPDHTQELPKKEKRPTRSLLRLFFTHLCLRLRKKQPVNRHSPSDPMEGPHTLLDPQNNYDSLQGTDNSQETLQQGYQEAVILSSPVYDLWRVWSTESDGKYTLQTSRVYSIPPDSGQREPPATEGGTGERRDPVSTGCGFKAVTRTSRDEKSRGKMRLFESRSSANALLW
ncbi:hypothetical protein AAFF_G00179960 [Aldrovandia affinis]|uniref:Protein kinase domain-containing protein n=1 Tax=Aldrovandia affinis TaxID=143900 RepID=A0AAD7T093_9TELE|nr:hypothetical protein AAFF_G00179960 [Aldrovandia affinis]